MLDVWPEHWSLWEAWRVLENRWRLVSDLAGTRRQALDLPQVESALRLLRIKRKARPQMTAWLLEMEMAALAELYDKGRS